MNLLMQEMGAKALALGVPLSVQIDLTYRCNERCVHCYLDHDDHGEMTTAEIRELLDELAMAGVFFLTFSGGEILLRRDFFELLEYARGLTFCVRLKTNALLIREREAERLRSVDVQAIQVSIYSHRAEVHDGITKVPGSLRRSVDAIRFLKAQGLNVTVASVLMVPNREDQHGVRQLAAELGVNFTLDPTVTPMMDGDRSILALNVSHAALVETLHDPLMNGGAVPDCAPPAPASEETLDEVPCSAGHTACYVSPYGDVYPCVQFPLSCGNVRQNKFLHIWRSSAQMNEVRSIRLRDLSSCSQCGHVSSCTRCPGLAFMEGDMRGPSVQDCEKSFARTGIPSRNLAKRKPNVAGLVQIAGLVSGNHALNA